MCENLLTEFFSSLFRDICIKTYWLCPSSFARWDICTETYRLCPFSFAHWDIYMKTYSLCPFSFVSRDIYARKNAICPIAADIRDIMQRNDSICPTVPKKARHNRAKIFYMSPGSPCLLPFFVCHGFLPADMRLVALFAHEDFCNLTLCCF